MKTIKLGKFNFDIHSFKKFFNKAFLKEKATSAVFFLRNFNKDFNKKYGNTFSAVSSKMKRNKLISIAVAFILFVLLLAILPAVKASGTQYSTILEDEAGNLLAAYIAPDGQWRFAPGGEIDEKYFEALIAFEDRRFNFHAGIDPLAVGRAIIANIKSGSIKSGASTITMQAVRMLRLGKSRTFKEKLIESVLAFQLELKYSKQEILELYAANAPYGGNVVGIEAASWRWFGRSAKELSVAEAALLAVLPNSPALIHPGKNREKLLKKRNRLLAKMFELKLITESEFELATDENLPEKPKKFPQLASHLLDEFIIKKENLHKRIVTTLNLNYQKLANETISRNSKMLAENGIFNAAVLIAEVNSGNILAYVGNTPSEQNLNNNKV
ncbi:MAG TPA: hypothetical protein DCQ31_18220, partial [Bacteroidales bacterium]|nr:hypothetical protein [Bacteroidales bacterium]